MKYIFTFLLLIPSILTSQNKWLDLSQKADSLTIDGKLDQAIQKRKEAEKIALDLEEETYTLSKKLSYITALHALMLENKKRDSVFPVLENEIKTLKIYDKYPSILSSQHKLLATYVYNIKRDFEKSKQLNNIALKYQRENKFKDTITWIKILRGQELIALNTQELIKAKKYGDTLLHLHKNLSYNFDKHLVKVYEDLAQLYNSNKLDVPSLKLKYLNLQEELLQKNLDGNLEQLVNLYVAMADHAILIGNYKESIGYLNKGWEIYTNNKDAIKSERIKQLPYFREIQYAHIYILAYSKLENNSKVEEYLKRVDTIVANNELQQQEFIFVKMSYLYGERFYRNIAPLKSTDYIKKGLRINKESPYVDLEADYLIDLAKIKLTANKTNEAIKLAEEGLLNKKIIYTVKLDGHKVLTECYARLNDIENTEKALNNLLKLLNINKDAPGLENIKKNQYTPSKSLEGTEILLRLTRLIKDKFPDYKNQSVLNKLAFKQFIGTADKYVKNQKFDTLFEMAITGLLEDLNNGELEYQEKKEFVEAVENVNSRFLLNQFISNRIQAEDDTFSISVAEEKILRGEITQLKKELFKKGDEKIKQQIFDKELKLKEIEKKILAEHPKIKDLLNPEFSLEKLEYDKNAYVKYIKASGVYYSIELEKGNIKIVNIGPTEQIEKNVADLLLLLKNPASQLKDIKALGNKLHKSLLSNITLKDQNFILADGILVYLPFDLLVKGTSFLVEDTVISYTRNFTLLSAENFISVTTKNDKVALFAPSYSSFTLTEPQLAVRGEPYNLNGAKAEVAEISKIVNSNSYIGTDATKQLFTQLPNDVSILHFSMHSFINDQDPDLSSLVFTDANKDHELYINELYGLNLNADLAVLSACSTGVGGYKNGKGLMSMSTAFTFAGVPATVSSLWNAPDLSTKEIMVSFYENLKNGNSKSLALQKAKKEYLNTTDNEILQHPYYWAGFVLNGNNQAITISENKLNSIWYIFLGLIIIVLFIIILKNRKK